MKFELHSNFKPTGDQPEAIQKLCQNIKNGVKHQVLLGITGSGKTYTLANVINKIQKPVLILSPNKTLATQLYQEFQQFFPNNFVGFFISYYDYYQPEAYIPTTDTYIAKDAKINKYIDELRVNAVSNLISRNDIIIVASVSAIYGIGDLSIYEKAKLILQIGDKIKRQELNQKLVSLQYKNQNIDPESGCFRWRENTIEIFLPTGIEILEVEFKQNIIINIKTKTNILRKEPNKISLPKLYTNYQESNHKQYTIYPATLFFTDKQKLQYAIKSIKSELKQELTKLKKQKKIVEYERLKKRTNYDIEMLKTTGYCNGIENYSRHLNFKNPGDPPFTLLGYYHYKFNNDFLIFVDESHITIPQLKGMYWGDRSRKETLINFGFRLPSALDNRPLKFNEFEQQISQIIYTSATPKEWEIKKSQGHIIEQLVRPTGIIDPKIEVRPCKTQIPDLVAEIEKQIKKGEKTLVLTLTKRSAQDLTDFLLAKNIKTSYLHSDIKPLQRPKIIEKLRTGDIDVIVGINLLREGLDLPEVTLIAILDADKEGYLRNKIALLQAIGRAARNTEGRAILYADTITDSIKQTIYETNRRRQIQQQYNKTHNITPTTIYKEIKKSFVNYTDTSEELNKLANNQKNVLKYLEKELQQAIKAWDFEKAAKLRDEIKKYKENNKKLNTE